MNRLLAPLCLALFAAGNHAQATPATQPATAQAQRADARAHKAGQKTERKGERKADGQGTARKGSARK